MILNRHWKFWKTPDLKKFVLPVLFLSFCAPLQAASRQTAVVETVLTGDSVRLKGGKELRYASLESPSPESTIALSREYGQTALEFNRKLVEGKTIEIEWGPQIRDSKRRLLGFVYLQDGTFVNRELLKNGHAKARITAPNLRHAEEFRADEMTARRAKAGLWLKEPYDPRLSSEIWGDKVTKTYFYPNSPELDDVPQAQLVRFRSRVEATSDGYRPCFSCRHRAAATDEPGSP